MRVPLGHYHAFQGTKPEQRQCDAMLHVTAVMEATFEGGGTKYTTDQPGQRRGRICASFSGSSPARAPVGAPERGALAWAPAWPVGC